MYTAVMIDKPSRQLLTWCMMNFIDLKEREFQLETPQKYKLPHHMTINMGEFDEILNNPEMGGKEAELEVDAFLYSHQHGVAAFRVSKAICIVDKFNEQPIKTINDGKSSKHITAAIFKGVKPFKANDLFKISKEKEESGSIVTIDLSHDPLFITGTIIEI